VAYAESVKFDVLGVRRGPVVTTECARQMAAGVARLLGADATIGITGVGGPGPVEGQPAGTTMIAVLLDGEVSVSRHQFDAEPSDVLAAVVDTAVILLADRMSA
jgi:nicotinamide-nucleotide amidase